MKWKFYLSAVLAAMMTLFVATSCSDDPDPEPIPGKKTTFTVKVKDITAAKATVEVAPSDNMATYYFGVSTKAFYDAAGSDANFLKAELAWFKAQAAEAKVTLEAYLKDVVSKGPDTDTFNDLTGETAYVAYVFAINVDGSMGTDLTKQVFTTPKATEPEPEPEPDIFAITVTDITASSANINVVPTDKAMRYFIDAFSEADYLELGGTPEGIAAYVPGLFARLAETLQMPLDEVVALLTEVGDATYAATEMAQQTKFYPIAIGVNAEGQPITATKVGEPFTTLKGADPSSLTFEIAVTNITDKAADINITPSDNNNTYFFDCQSAKAIDGLTDAEIIQALYDVYSKDGKFETLLSMGPDGLSAETIAQYAPFKPDTEYCVLVFGWADGAATTTLTKKLFKTLPAGPGPDPSGLTFETTVANITDVSVAVSITPSASAETDTYFWDVQKASLVAKFPTDEELIAALFEAYGGAAEFPTYLSTGAVSNSVVDNLKAETDYVVLVFGWHSGGATTGLTKKAFTTTPKPDLPLVESTLFTDLLGDWTATMNGTVTFPVKIAAGANDATAAVYRKLNRLVCLGFECSTEFPMVYRSPEDLIAGKEGEYWVTYPEDAVNDYGPKWFLQIATGDVVTVPANNEIPLHYYKASPAYLLGVNGTKLRTAGDFPTTISADKNTITVTCYVNEGKSYYPSALVKQSTGWGIVLVGTTDLVLTRNTPATAGKKLVSGLPSSHKGGVRHSAIEYLKGVNGVVEHIGKRTNVAVPYRAAVKPAAHRVGLVAHRGMLQHNIKATNHRAADLRSMKSQIRIKPIKVVRK
ncbi:MAG: hypothetical protein RR330_04105 [Alistipes sp.]